jgi:DNA-binding NarL/FixJ family response regulator
MAETLGLTEADVAARLSGILARLGATSRAEATSLAFRGFSGSAGIVGARA